MDDRSAGVSIPGLRALQRDMKRIEPEASKELAREFKAVAQKVATDASSHAPSVTGRYAKSIKVYAAKGGASVGSRLPQAGVLHWGGTIEPRGVPIVFPRSAVIYEAAERQADDIEDRVGDAIERAAKRAGWT